ICSRDPRRARTPGVLAARSHDLFLLGYTLRPVASEARLNRPAQKSRGSSPAGCSTRTSRCRLPAPAEYSASSRAFLPRSEEHTSELQSRFDIVCRLLLEKKKQKI